jgi:hypothetical protein
MAPPQNVRKENRKESVIKLLLDMALSVSASFASAQVSETTTTTTTKERGRVIISRSNHSELTHFFENNAAWAACMRSLKSLWPVGALTVFVSLCSCDANLFGRGSREIAGGYRLMRANNPNEFVLTIPNERGGLIIDEIGWRKPFILARASGSQYWYVINTAHAQHTRLSDGQRKSDPIYQSVQIQPAETAWKNLGDHNRLW